MRVMHYNELTRLSLYWDKKYSLSLRIRADKGIHSMFKFISNLIAFR